MLLLRLAWRNLSRTGLRLWINASVIALSVVVILFLRGLYAGMGRQMWDSLRRTESGGGQFWARGFDPLDPTSFDEGRAPVPPSVRALVGEGRACTVLQATGTLYHEGRVLPVTLRGIEPSQDILELPTAPLAQEDRDGVVPVLLGTRMMATLALRPGDSFVIKWRDAKGVFDGTDFAPRAVMDTVNPRVDSGTVWLSTGRLQRMLAVGNEASYVVVKSPADMGALADLAPPAWTAHTEADLSAWVRGLVRDKERGGTVLFVLLLFLSCVGIFNSQTLAVFKRRREIGMLMALGMRRRQIVALFTLEGVLTCLLGFLLALVLGSPLLWWTATTGLSMAHVKDLGAPIPERLTAHFTADLVLLTTLLIFLVTTLVAWWPTAAISRLSPVKALTGRH